MRVSGLIWLQSPGGVEAGPRWPVARNKSVHRTYGLTFCPPSFVIKQKFLPLILSRSAEVYFGCPRGVLYLARAPGLYTSSIPVMPLEALGLLRMRLHH